MRFCRKIIELLGLCLLLALDAQAAEIEIREPRLVAADDGYALCAHFDIPFSARLEEAVHKGVSLYFTLNFELESYRWYWRNEKIANTSKSFRLSYHAVTRRYRLSTGGLHQHFSALEEALSMISHVRDWTVVASDAVRPGKNYQARLKMSLDLSAMPRTFQIDALFNDDWSLASDWTVWELAIPEQAKEGGEAVPPTGGGGNGKNLAEFPEKPK